MRYLIREMEEKDIEEIVAGEQKIFGESLGYDMIYGDLKLNPLAYYMVLEIDKHVHGYIGLWIDEKKAQVINFYIDEEYQNMGFGGMMLDFAIKLCEMSACDELSLEVRPSNEKALYIYEKYGFNYSHTRKKYYKNGEDALLLIKKIEVAK